MRDKLPNIQSFMTMNIVSVYGLFSLCSVRGEVRGGGGGARGGGGMVVNHPE